MIKIRPNNPHPGQVQQPLTYSVQPTIGNFGGASQGQNQSWLMTTIIWVLIVFMVVPEGFDYESLLVAASPTTGSAVSRIIWLALLGGSLAIIVTRMQLAKAVLRGSNPYFWAFVGLSCASILWSVDSGLTIRRMIRIFTIAFAAFAFSLVAWRDGRFQSVVRVVFTALLLGSIVFVMVDPRLGIEQIEQAELIGAWHGLATQKNGFGSLAGLATLLWIHAYMVKSGRRPVSMIFIVVSVFCLIKARSSTALMATIFSALLMLILIQTPKGLKRYMPYLIGTFVAIILLYSIAVLRLVPGLGFLLKPITMITGKDLTFTGRTAIWEIVNEHIALHPFLGTGYGAYWVGPKLESASFQMWARLSFYPGQAHNGYLDVINDLGYVGGLILIGFVVVYLRQAINLFMLNRAQGSFFLVILFQQLIGNLSESHWLNARSVEFVIMTIATMALSRSLLQAQQQQLAQRRASVGFAEANKMPSQVRSSFRRGQN